MKNTWDYMWNSHFRVCLNCFDNIPDYITTSKQRSWYLKMKVAKNAKLYEF